MYNFIWNISYIYKDVNTCDECITYAAEFDKENSHPMFNDFGPAKVEFKDIVALEEELIAYDMLIEEDLVKKTHNYLSSIDPYNRIIDSTDIQFNYIRHE